MWRAGIEDYRARLNQPAMPEDLAPLRRLLAHLLATDPERFWVATGPDDEVVEFASASVREGLWFLAMLFVLPGTQARGIGQALMDHAQAGTAVLPGGPAVPGPDDPLDSGIHTWGMCTDAVQPISNGLYARRGVVPGSIWRLFGVRRWAAVPPPPPGLESVAFESVAATEPDGERRLQAILDEAGPGGDRRGAADHGFLRRDGRVRFLLRDRGTGATLGYVYGSGIGRMGPLLALDPALHPTLVGVAVRETPALGPVACGSPGRRTSPRGHCWTPACSGRSSPASSAGRAPTTPFERYLPISLALV